MGATVRDMSSTGTWLRSSRCNPELNCVEVTTARAGVIIRDSKDETALPPLDTTQWTAFLAYCRTTR